MKRENKEGQRKVLEAPEYDIDLKDPVVEVVARKIQAFKVYQARKAVQGTTV